MCKQAAIYHRDAGIGCYQCYFCVELQSKPYRCHAAYRMVLPGTASGSVVPITGTVRLTRGERVAMLCRAIIDERVVVVVVGEGTSAPDSKSWT